jgi:hypothetical protein
MGMHIFSNLSDLKTAAFPINVVATRRSFLGKNREVVSASCRHTVRASTNSSRIKKKPWRFPING